MGPRVGGNVLESRPRGRRPGRDPESQGGSGAGPGGGLRRPTAARGQLPHSGGSGSPKELEGAVGLRRARRGPGGPSVPGFSVLTFPHPTPRPGREGAGMDWAVGLACCQEGAGDQAGPATGQCWAVPPPPGWQSSLVWNSGTRPLLYLCAQLHTLPSRLGKENSPLPWSGDRGGHL